MAHKIPGRGRKKKERVRLPPGNRPGTKNPTTAQRAAMQFLRVAPEIDRLIEMQKTPIGRVKLKARKLLAKLRRRKRRVGNA